MAQETQVSILIFTCICVCMYIYVCIYACICLYQGCTECKGGAGMEWLRLVDSLKLYVSFAEYSLFYRALLQQRPIIFRSLLIEATS